MSQEALAANAAADSIYAAGQPANFSQVPLPQYARLDPEATRACRDGIVRFPAAIWKGLPFPVHDCLRPRARPVASVRDCHSTGRPETGELRAELCMSAATARDH